MAGDFGEKVRGRRLEDSLNASPADAELLTRAVPCQYFLLLTENWVISAQTTPLVLLSLRFLRDLLYGQLGELVHCILHDQLHGKTRPTT